jgi:GH25 family lysozyme M1 (1,4-beta-N-acetylmuramidase)
MNYQYHRIKTVIGNQVRGAYELERAIKAPHTDRSVSPTAMAATGTINIKQPPSFDISHWKIVNDWNALKEVAPLMMMTKATEADNYKDETFPEFFTKFRDILHCNRGAYHFFRKTVDPVRQANWFVDYIIPYITNDDWLILDFEEGGETAGQLWAFLDQVKKRRPNNRLMNYSRKGLMDAIVMNSSEKEFFKKILTWPAGYPVDPNPYTTIPSGYIPDQTKWGPVGVWQYTSHGTVPGIDGSTDMNLLEPVLIDQLTPLPGADADVVTYPYDGFKHVKGRRFGSDVYVSILDTTKARFEVVHEPVDNGLFRPSEKCIELNAQFAVNGDEYDKHSTAYLKTPVEYAVSNGSPYVARKTSVPSLNIRQSGQPEIGHTNFSSAYNVTSGYRYLIQSGITQAYLYGTEVQYTERHPRSCFGITLDGRYVVSLTADGRTTKSTGLTLLECANVLKEFGAYTAYDRGSGGDSVEVIDGVIQNVPCDTDAQGNPGVERAVSQAVLAYFNQNNNGGSMAYRYTAKAIGDNTRIRDQHNTAGNVLQSVNANALLEGDVLFTATEQLRNSAGEVYQYVGDKWLEVKTINGAPFTPPAGKQAWVAITNKGAPICVLTDNGPVNPPVDPPVDPPVTPPTAKTVTVTVTETGYTPLTMTGTMNPE